MLAMYLCFEVVLKGTPSVGDGSIKQLKEPRAGYCVVGRVICVVRESKWKLGFLEANQSIF